MQANGDNKEYTGIYKLPKHHMKTTISHLISCYKNKTYEVYNDKQELIKDIAVIYAKLQQFPDYELLMECSCNLDEVHQDYETFVQVFYLPIVNKYKELKKRRRFMNKQGLKRMQDAYIKEGKAKKKAKRKAKKVYSYITKYSSDYEILKDNNDQE